MSTRRRGDKRVSRKDAEEIRRLLRRILKEYRQLMRDIRRLEHG